MTSLSSRVRELWTDTKAVAATEFAIVVPFMLLLYLGGVELGNGLAINVKVTTTAHSIADMVSQNTQVSTAQLQTMLSNSAQIMSPYARTATITVTGISTDSNGKATVQW